MSVSVTVKDNGSLDSRLRIFKARVAKDGTLTAAKGRQEYKKPGVRRREEKKKNIMNSRRNSKKNNSYSRSNSKKYAA